MFKQKKVRITVNPETFENFSPETIKGAVSRRIAGAASNNRRVLNAALAFTTVLMLMCVVALAGNVNKVDETDSEPESTPVVTTLVMWQGGMAPWGISEEDKAEVMAVVAAVARSETPLAQQTVAQAVRNACEDFDMTVSEVIAEFRWPTKRDYEASESMTEAVERVIDGYRAIDATVYFAYNPAVQTGEWHEDRSFVCQVGSLRFFA